MATQSAKASEIERKWYVVDAAGQPLGRLASKVAHVLRGKHRPEFTPHVDTGDYVIVVNAGDVKVTGRKLQDKMYYRHTGYIGNMKSTNLEKLLAEKPEKAIQYAVKGMMPKNPLGRAMYKKLRVFAGAEHPHEAQQPKPLEI